MSNEKNLKKRIFEIIQIGNKFDLPSTVFDYFIVPVILINILVTFLMTFEGTAGIEGLLKTIEFITIVIFTVEYALRVWTAQYLYPRNNRAVATIRYIFSFLGIIDLITILPYFLPFFFPSGAVAFRMFRVVRILHLFRINANYDAFNVITDVLKEKKNQLISSVFLITVLLMASSLCMYDLEHAAQPENFTNAFSGIWWSVSTLLTVGYGDIYPITAMGRVMAIVIAFLGVGVVAIPTGIISAGFVEYYTKIKAGLYGQKESDFITLKIDETHPYVGQALEDIEYPKGIYVAVILREGTLMTPHPESRIVAGDYILFGTSNSLKLEGKMEEISLIPKHPWIGKRISELDISRLSFVVMIKRKDHNVCPEGNTVLKEEDLVILLDRKQG